MGHSRPNIDSDPPGLELGSINHQYPFTPSFSLKNQDEVLDASEVSTVYL